MTGINRLGDRVCIGTAAEAACSFREKANSVRAVGSWISKNTQRSDLSLTLFNLLSASARYLDVAAENVEGHVSVMALATRSLYEINLQTRDILDSTDALRRWNGEAVTDGIQILEGILEVETVSEMGTQRTVLRNEVDRLKSLRGKFGLPDTKPLGAGDIAKSVGKSGEHKALFKLFSKLVHPSSYLINDYKHAASSEIMIILQDCAWLYAEDTFSRICDAVSMPRSVRKSLEGIQK